MTLHVQCPECGVDYDEITPHDAAGFMRMLPRRYRNVLTRVFRPGEDLEELIRRRPEPGVWSALEYTAHTAQTLDLLAPALRKTALEDNPFLFAFEPDEQAEEQAYNDWTLLQALSELESACADLSMAIEYTEPANWARVGTYPEPKGERSAVDLAREAVHEGIHHLRDVRRVLGAVLGREVREP